MKKLFFLLAVFTFALEVQAKIKLPSIISDNMVLQQKSSVKLWGWANPYEKVSIQCSWNRKTVHAIADKNGKWSTYIQTPKESRGEELRFSGEGGNEEITVKNILIGEVWLASGQSNMEFWCMPKESASWMTGMYNWEKETANAGYPDIHLFKVSEDWDHTAPKDDCKGKWVVCSKEEAKKFSAVAFLFARELHTTLKSPVGVILCAVGGTHAESWIREELMRKDTIYNRVFKSYAPDIAAKKGYLHKVPASIWNAMVNPISGYTIKGNIWYQAESNAWRAGDYAPIFTDLVTDWRAVWNQKRLPFYFMQVAPYNDLPGEIRMEQAKVWERKMLKDIGMATAIDVGDSLDIHPKEKVIPAHRLALWALAKEYKMDIECCGPVLDKVKIKGNKMILSFKHGKGLYIKDNNGNMVYSGARYLYIAGKDGIYYPALSQIANGKLIVWSRDVPQPVHVRYCTENYCKGNIYNSDGLPAYPWVM